MKKYFVPFLVPFLVGIAGIVAILLLLVGVISFKDNISDIREEYLWLIIVARLWAAAVITYLIYGLGKFIIWLNV